MRQWVQTCLLAACLATLAGCGDGKPATVPAAGRVMFGGQPAAGALVVFHPADPAREKEIGGKPFGKVQEDGTFTLTTFREGDGAPEGEYGVTVDLRAASAGKLTLSGEGGPAGKPLLKPKYGDPRDPALKATVKRGGPNQFSFEVD